MPSLLVSIEGGISINKEEILAISRKENKDKDLFAIEVQVVAGHIGSLAAILLATVFFVTQSLMGEGFNFGLYAIILSVSAGGFIYKTFRLRRGRDLAFAAVYSVATLILSVVHLTDIG